MLQERRRILVELGPYEDLMFQSYAQVECIDSLDTTSADKCEHHAQLYSSRVTRSLDARTGKGRLSGFILGVRQLSYIPLSVWTWFNETFNGSTDLTAFEMEEWWQNSGIGISANSGFTTSQFKL